MKFNNIFFRLFMDNIEYKKAAHHCRLLLDNYKYNVSTLFFAFKTLYYLCEIKYWIKQYNASRLQFVTQ